MKKTPSVQEIRSWLISKNPLGHFDNTECNIENIDPRPWSGHFNYLITTSKFRAVLRFKGPEWGEPTQGITDEYNILKTLESYEIAPHAYYLDEQFFGEAVMLEEYMEGEIVNTLPYEIQQQLFPDIARYIAKINMTPVGRDRIPHYELFTSYEVTKKEWRSRLDTAHNHPPSRGLALQIESILPRAEAVLDRFEKRLTRVLAAVPPSLVFVSSHAGHCLKRTNDVRFFNWEQVSFGDPSYTLAVFLVSIKDQPNFKETKEVMIAAYLERNPVPEFAELVDQRLAEREIANLTWSLWSHATRQDERPAEETGTMRRFESVRAMLETI